MALLITKDGGYTNYPEHRHSTEEVMKLLNITRPEELRSVLMRGNAKMFYTDATSDPEARFNRQATALTNQSDHPATIVGDALFLTSEECPA